MFWQISQQYPKVCGFTWPVSLLASIAPPHCGWGPSNCLACLPGSVAPVHQIGPCEPFVSIPEMWREQRLTSHFNKINIAHNKDEMDHDNILNRCSIVYLQSQKFHRLRWRGQGMGAVHTPSQYQVFGCRVFDLSFLWANSIKKVEESC